MKQTLDRQYAAYALREFFGPMTKDDLMKMREMDIDLKNEFCSGCYVRVDIVGVQVHTNIIDTSSKLKYMSNYL